MSHVNWYRTFWRWHFYAGLFCLPFVFVLALSGAVYLFKPQIESVIDAPMQIQDSHNLSPRLAMQHINAALQALPNAQFFSYQLAQTASDPVKITLYLQGEKVFVYIDPYNLSVLKIISRDDQFMRLVKKFHGELLLGDKGSLLVELAASWAIVLVLSGVYLWWPKNTRSLAGVLYPRLKLSGRIFWRDLHSVTGFWLAFFILFLLLSGLPWTQVWGGAFKAVKSWYPSTEIVSGWSRNQQEEKRVWRAIKVSSEALASAPLSQEILEKAQSLEFAHPAELSLSDSTQGIWRLSSNSQNRPLREKAWIDSASLDVIQTETFSDKRIIYRIVGIGIAAHEGQLFGWPNQLLGLVVALGLVLLSVTGAWLWWQRKPDDQLGAPKASTDPKAQQVVLSLMLIFALFLPLLLASIIAMVLFELLVLPRLPKLAKWLGA